MAIKILDHCVNKCKHRVFELKADGSNAEQFYKADTLMLNGDEFRNYGGYPRNEIAIINEQQSAAVAQSMLERMCVLPDDSKLDSQVSDFDLKLSLRSRYCQTPSEQIAHTEEILRIRDERIAQKKADLLRKAEVQKRAKEREALWNSLTEEERQEILKKKRDKELETLI